MAEITKKRMGELKRGILTILSQQPEGLPAKEIIARMEKLCPPTTFEQSDYPKQPGVRRFDKIIRFTTISPVKAGWMTKSQGIWTIADEGKRVLEKFKDPEALQEEANRLYSEWEEGQPDKEEPAGSSPAASSTFEEASEGAWVQIEEYLGKLNPFDFQRLVSELLRAMGYSVSWVAPPGQDGGVDIVAHTDPLGTTAPRIKVQVKRRADKVDIDTPKAFLSTLGDQDVGIFVSLGGFTTTAEATARSQEKRRITLIDLERLVSLWIEHYKKLDETARRLLPLKPIYYLLPTE